ncbi:MAG: type II toxin-antitoxin system HicA family toxin [Candidatus Melainabacteria bacterium]|nr:type II toxin-antitoxin system HicA family toxin [Candidatus Melainabacteria bacterium]
MSKKVPSLHYFVVLKVLRKTGWVIVRQKGSHIRLHKHTSNEILKITVPAHSPIKRSTLSHILKQAKIDLDDFLGLI